MNIDNLSCHQQSVIPENSRFVACYLSKQQAKFNYFRKKQIEDDKEKTRDKKSTIYVESR